MVSSEVAPAQATLPERTYNDLAFNSDGSEVPVDSWTRHQYRLARGFLRRNGERPTPDEVCNFLVWTFAGKFKEAVRDEKVCADRFFSEFKRFLSDPDVLDQIGRHRENLSVSGGVDDIGLVRTLRDIRIDIDRIFIRWEEVVRIQLTIPSRNGAEAITLQPLDFYPDDCAPKEGPSASATVVESEEFALSEGYFGSSDSNADTLVEDAAELSVR